MNILRKISNFFLWLITFFLIFISIYLIRIIIISPDINLSLTHEVKTIYDTNNKKLNTSDYYLDYVAYNDISPNLINALLATEDDTFFNHHGINIKRMLKAMIENIKSKSYKEGASTINQQLIKNMILTSDKTINRKISELVLSYKLDLIYTKEQILELYLNNILFGQNVYGIKEAALYYFNKEPHTLSIDESALLAGLIQLPNYYNPYNNFKAGLERRNIVLGLMQKKNFITKKEYKTAIDTNLATKLNKNEKFTKKSYLNSYLDYLSIAYPTKNNRIHTYLNQEIQQYLTNIALNKFNHFSNDNIKVAMVMLDNKTGGVLSIVGNRDLNRKVINYALEKKQMASTFKPLIAYGPALEYLNLSPASVVVDEEYSYSNGIPLRNWDYQYKGAISLRKALSESRNIPALKVYQKTTDEQKIEFMNKLGLDVPEKLIEPEALGAGLNTYSLLEIASAYSVYARMGKYIKTSPVKEASGFSYYKNNEESRQVIKESTAFFMNSMLHDVFKNSKYNISNGYLAAKTGTSNFDKETREKYNIPLGSSKDSYVISYTKDITFGIWVGYDIVGPNSYLTAKEATISKRIMKQVMDKYKQDASSYDAPKNVVLAKVSITDENLYLDPYGYYDYFIVGSAPFTYYRKKEYYEA